MRAESEAHARLLKAYSICPELKEIDSHFPKIGQAILEAFSTDPSKAERKIALLRKDSEELNMAREECLKSAGLDKDYTSPRYNCDKCQDTGYLEFRMCDCMKRELVLAGFRSSGLGALLDRQSFENFSLNYYKEDPKNHRLMEKNLAAALEYAENFTLRSGNLLFMGRTGLGKTHLSTAIARTVIERGFDVRYDTAQNIFADFEFDRFKSNYGTEAPRSDKYLEADLLIIDDLGTETVTQFTLACLYNIINSRQNAGRPTIINTNLGDGELQDRYNDRIVSRLLGEYRPLLFVGEDVRYQKLT